MKVLAKTGFVGVFMVLFLIFSEIVSLSGVKNAVAGVNVKKYMAFINGKWASDFENELNENHAFYDPSVQFWGGIEYAVFKDGRKGVLVGDDGWFFTTEEFDYYKNREDNIKKHLTYVADVQKMLEKRGIGLVVALVPAKARMCSAKLGRYGYPSYNAGFYDYVLKNMRENHINVVDLRKAVTGDANRVCRFLRNDTHWNPEGAAASAGVISVELKHFYPDVELTHSGFDSVFKEKVEHEGDLMRYLPAAKLGSPEEINVFSVTKSIDSDGGDGLFGDDIIPVTLVGTSYSANPLWGFEGALKMAMGVDILNVADEGKGPFVTMKAWIESDVIDNSPPSIVIWEIPERYIPAEDMDT